MKEIEESQNQKEVTKTSIMEHPNPQEQKFHSLLLPSTGSEGTAIVYNLHKTLKIVKTCVTYTGQKLNSRFQITDKINEKHKHDLIYYTKSSETSCNENYPGETGYRIIERVADYDGKHKKSHLMKHALTQNHWHFDLGNMKIIDFSFHNNKLKPKILRQFTSKNIGC